jgi:Rha family phage regulatory protein
MAHHLAHLRTFAVDPVLRPRRPVARSGQGRWREHKHVLRDVDGILTASDLRASNWFRPVSYLDAKGEERRSFDLTHQGFTLLVMGWTGERALHASDTHNFLTPLDVPSRGGPAPAPISRGRSRLEFRVC